MLSLAYRNLAAAGMHLGAAPRKVNLVFVWPRLQAAEAVRGIKARA